MIKVVSLLSPVLALMFVLVTLQQSLEENAICHRTTVVKNDEPNYSEKAAVPRKAVNFREILHRMEELFADQPQATQWGKDAERAINTQLSLYCKSKKGKGKLLNYRVECRGDSICRLLIEYDSVSSAIGSDKHILTGKMFKWDGTLYSAAHETEDGESPTIQELFLVSRAYSFDGLNLSLSDARREQ